MCSTPESTFLQPKTRRGAGQVLSSWRSIRIQAQPPATNMVGIFAAAPVGARSAPGADGGLKTAASPSFWNNPGAAASFCLLTAGFLISFYAMQVGQLWEGPWGMLGLWECCCTGGWQMGCGSCPSEVTALVLGGQRAFMQEHGQTRGSSEARAGQRSRGHGREAARDAQAGHRAWSWPQPHSLSSSELLPTTPNWEFCPSTGWTGRDYACAERQVRNSRRTSKL